MNRKKQARRLSFSFAVFLAAVLFSQVLIGWVFAKYFPVYTEASWYPFFISALPNYLIGMPLFLFMTRKIPESPLLGGERYTAGTVLRYAIIGIAISNLFAILGQFLHTPFAVRFGVDENILEKLIRNADVFSIVLFVVILAPIMEEWLFRRRFLNKALQFGKTNAVVAGGLAFGLFHLNIPQFVYATALGIFWGMVYVRHRSFILVVVLHMITNAIGSLLMPWLAFQVNGGETIGGSFILLMIVAGPVLLFRDRRGFYAAMRDDTKEGGKKNPSLIFNIGFFVYVLLVVAVVVGMATLVVN